MIKLVPQIDNDVVFTLTEKEGQIYTYGGPLYKLYLTNCQTNKLLGPYSMTDLSTNPKRYNLFTINPAVTLDNLAVTADLTLDSDGIYFVRGNITVSAGKTLTIPTTTYIIITSTSQVINAGTITNLANIIVDSSFTTSSTSWISVGTPQLSDGLFLLDFASGYYDYEVKTFDDATSLEIGKLLIRDTAPTQLVSTTYSTNITTSVYHG